MTTRTYRLAQGSLYGPATLQSIAQRGVTCSKFCRPIREVHPSAKRLKDVVVAAILTLLFQAGPSHVAWFVVPVHVDPVKGVVLRAPADISQERREIVTPLVAHRDSATTVVFESNGALFEASGFRGHPRAVLACSALSVCRVLSHETITVDAATALSPTRDQVRGHNVDHLSAFAQTPPALGSVSRQSDTQHGQSTEHTAGQVYASHVDHCNVIAPFGTIV